MNTGNIVGAVIGAVTRVAVTVVIILVVFKGASLSYDYGYRIFTEPAMSAGEGRIITVAVTEDMSATDIGKMFEEKGLVRDAKLFALQYTLSEYKKDVVPGIFDLSTAMTAEDMMAVMAGAGSQEEEIE